MHPNLLRIQTPALHTLILHFEKIRVFLYLIAKGIMRGAARTLCILFAVVVALALLVFGAQYAMTTPILELRAFRRLQCRVPAQCMENTPIPKVIYRTAKTKALSPTHQQAWDFTAKHNPDFEQVLLDDDDAEAFMRTAMDGYAHAAYSALVPGAAKADLLRYVLMYEKGGVYLDIKSGARELCRLIRPGDQMLVSTWDTRALQVLGFATFLVSTPLGKRIWPESFLELQQWWLVCRPGHPVMRRVVRAVVEEVSGRVRQGRLQKEPLEPLRALGRFCLYCDVLRTTGPHIFTREVVDALDAGEDQGVRQVCANATGICVYDVAGKHNGGSDGGEGPLLRDTPSFSQPQHSAGQVGSFIRQ